MCSSFEKSYLATGIIWSLCNFVVVFLKFGDFKQRHQQQSYTTTKLHKDHIIPVARYDFSKEEHKKACFLYTHLQFLTQHENQVKSNKLPDGLDFEATVEQQVCQIEKINKDGLDFKQVYEKQQKGKLFEGKGWGGQQYSLEASKNLGIRM